jgi:hypothetical protein
MQLSVCRVFHTLILSASGNHFVVLLRLAGESIPVAGSQKPQFWRPCENCKVEISLLFILRSKMPRSSSDYKKSKLRIVICQLPSSFGPDYCFSLLLVAIRFYSRHLKLLLCPKMCLPPRTPYGGNFLVPPSRFQSPNTKRPASKMSWRHSWIRQAPSRSKGSLRIQTKLGPSHLKAGILSTLRS